MAQTKTITGVVVDATGEPVIGASVLEVGTTNGTISARGGKTGCELYRLQNTTNCSGSAKHLQGYFKRRCRNAG